MKTLIDPSRLSKRFWLFLIASFLIALNDALGLQISEDILTQLLTLAGVGIAGYSAQDVVRTWKETQPSEISIQPTIIETIEDYSNDIPDFTPPGHGSEPPGRTKDKQTSPGQAKKSS